MIWRHNSHLGNSHFFANTLLYFIRNSDWKGCPTYRLLERLAGWANPADDGYAGQIGSGQFIDALKIEGGTNRVAIAGKPYFDWVKDSKSESGEGWAGDEIGSKRPIAAVLMRA